MILDENVIIPTKGFFQLEIDFFNLINQERNKRKFSRKQKFKMKIKSNLKLFEIFDQCKVDILNCGISEIRYQLLDMCQCDGQEIYLIELYE